MKESPLDMGNPPKQYLENNTAHFSLSCVYCVLWVLKTSFSKRAVPAAQAQPFLGTKSQQKKRNQKQISPLGFMAMKVLVVLSVLFACGVAVPKVPTNFYTKVSNLK